MVGLIFSTMLLSRLVGDAISFNRQRKHNVKPEQRRVIHVKGKWFFLLGLLLFLAGAALAVWSGWF